MTEDATLTAPLCPDGATLTKHAAGTLADAAAPAVAAHLGQCARCRSLLAELERQPTRILRRRAPARRSGPSEEMLRTHLAEDEAQRELKIVTWVAIAAAAALVSVDGVMVPLLGLPRLPLITAGMTALFAWNAGMAWLLRRGVYRPWLRYANAFVETSICPALIYALGTAFGREVAYASPLFMVWSTLLVTSALRLDPRLSIFGGVLSLGQLAVLVLALGIERGPNGSWALGVPGMRALTLLFSASAGALISTYVVRRAGDALKQIREQDLMAKYILHEQLGAGGMAEVYLATYCPEGGFRKRVAVKRVLAEYARDPFHLDVLREEAQLGAMLAHPNVVQVYDCGTFRGAFVLAMEYVDGISLERLLELRGAPLPLPAVAFIAAELASALDYIHNRRGEDGLPLRLVHRDLNPPNVLLSRHGEVKLSDFGVARAAPRQAVTEDGFFGKERYAAPEQLRAGPVDGRTDLFALGLTLHWLLKGALPGETENDRTVPSELTRIVTGLTAQEMGRRTATASQVRSALLALPPELSPYPTGEAQLRQALLEVLGADPSRSTAVAPAPAAPTIAIRGRRAR